MAAFRGKRSLLGAHRTTLEGDWLETEAVEEKKRRERTRWGEIQNVGEERRKEVMREWKGKMGWSKEGESSMLFRTARLPNSLKRPGLRFGLPTKRWISAFLWAFLPPSPITTLHTRSFYQLSPCVLLFEVWATWCFHAVLNFILQGMAVLLIVSYYKVLQSQLNWWAYGHHKPPQIWHAQYANKYKIIDIFQAGFVAFSSVKLLNVTVLNKFIEMPHEKLAALILHTINCFHLSNTTLILYLHNAAI